jgi:DHA2 family multidrug resistance protein-like MFS transporter
MAGAPSGSPEARDALALGAALRPLLPLFVIDVLTAFTVGMVPPLLPLLAAEWQLSPLQVGMVNTFYALGRLGTSYPASALRARHGTRTVVFLGLALLVVGVVACGLARAFPAFLAARLVMGVGASAAFLAIFAELLEAAPAAWRGRLTNGFEGMAILSLGVGGMLGAWIAGEVGWRWVFVGAGPVVLLCALAWRRLDPEAGRQRVGTAVAGHPAGPAAHRRLLPVYVASLSLAMTWAGLFATMAPLLGHTGYRLSSGALGLALGAGYAAELAGLLGVALVIDRIRREPVFLGGAAAVAAGGLVLAVGTHPLVFVLGLVLVGSGFAVWMVPAIVLTDRVGTPMPPGYFAVYRIAMDAGMIVGPFALGAVADLLGARAAVAGAGLLLVAGGLVLGLGRR